MNVTITTKSINSNRLKKDLLEVISPLTITLVNIETGLQGEPVYRVQPFVEGMKQMCEYLIEKKIITQYDIIGDHRNNSDVSGQSFTVDVSFRQTNCLNVSKIKIVFRV